MSKKYIISVYLLLLFNVVLSQNNNKRSSTPETRILSYQELLDEMVSCKDSVYELNKAIVQYDAEKDKRFVS